MLTPTSQLPAVDFTLALCSWTACRLRLSDLEPLDVGWALLPVQHFVVSFDSPAGEIAHLWELSTNTQSFAAQISLAKEKRKDDMRKLITYHSSVAKAARFVDATRRDSLPGVIPHLTPFVVPPLGGTYGDHRLKAELRT